MKGYLDSFQYNKKLSWICMQFIVTDILNKNWCLIQVTFQQIKYNTVPNGLTVTKHSKLIEAHLISCFPIRLAPTSLLALSQKVYHLIFAAIVNVWMPIYCFIVSNVNFPYKTSIDEWLIFCTITRCYSDDEYYHSFVIATGDTVFEIISPLVWCKTPMRVRFVHVRICSTVMAGMRHDFATFNSQ